MNIYRYDKMYGDGDNRFKTQEFVAHSTNVNCLCFGTSNTVLATGGEDYKVNIWRVGNVSNIWTLGKNKSPIDCLCFDMEEKNVVSGARSGAIKVFDLNAGELARSLTGHPNGVTSIQYHPYGEFVVSGSVDCTMKVWDLRNKSCIQTYNGHTKEITSVRFSPDGKWVASASKDGQMLFWDLVAGKLVNSIKLQPNHVRTFEFNPTEFRVAAATSMRTVRFWDLETMDSLGITSSESNQIQAIAYSSSGSALCTASKDSLRLWDVEGNHMNLKCAVNPGWEKIDDMRISNDFELIAGSCMSNFVSVWSVDLQELVDSAKEQQDNVDDQYRDARGGTSTKSNVSATSATSNVSNVNTSRKDAKAVDSPAVAPSGRGNQQQQLSDVRKQMAQLSTDLGFGAGADKVPAQRVTSNSRYASSGADASSDNDSSVASTPRLPASRYAESKGGDSDDIADEKGSDRRPTSYSAAAKRDVDIPEVVWEEGHSRSQEMATSMGESFWKRFNESGGAARKHPTTAQDDQHKAAFGDFNEYDEDFEKDDVDDADFQAMQRLSVKEDVGPTDAELEDLLPPSSYGQKATPNEDAKVEDRRSVGRPQVRSTPLASVGMHVPEESASAAANVARKTPTPAFVKAPVRQATPAGPSSNDAAGSARLGSAAAPAMEVVGNNRHLRSPPAVANGAGNEHKRVTDLLEQLLTDSGPVKSALAQRLQSLKVLRKDWERGEVSDAIEQLSILSEAMPHNPANLSTLADFFDSVELRGNGLSLDACVLLLPVLDNMIAMSESWNSEHVICCTFKSLVSLAAAFGELIRNTRATIRVAGGVDLNREARLNKCNVCHEVFSRVHSRVEFFKRKFKASRNIVEVLDSYHSQCVKYFL